MTHDIRDLWSRGGFVFWGGFIGAVVRLRAHDPATRNFRSSASPTWRGSPSPRGTRWAAPAAGRSATTTASRTPVHSPSRFPTARRRRPSPQMRRLSRRRSRPAPIPTRSCRCIRRSCSRSLLGLVMFGILWRMRDHKHAEGWLFGVYCVLAGVERFIIEFFRAKDDRFAGRAAEHRAGDRDRHRARRRRDHGGAAADRAGATGDTGGGGGVGIFLPTGAMGVHTLMIPSSPRGVADGSREHVGSN